MRGGGALVALAVACCCTYTSVAALPSLPVRGGARGGKGAAASASSSAPAVNLPPTSVTPLGKDVRTGLVIATAAAALGVFRVPAVREFFNELKPIHPWFPLARHQLLMFAAWAMNMIAVRVPGRSDGSSWRDTFSVRFFTPSGWAFAIWAPIFLGETLLAGYQLLSGVAAKPLQPYLARLSAPFATAFVAQSLWCFAFRPWAFDRQYLSSALLGLTAFGLSQVHAVLRDAATAGAMRPWDYVLVHLPLSLHFGWITCATLVNLNGWFALAPIKTGDKLGLALASVNVAVTLGSQVSLVKGDPIIAWVVAWALFAVADDLRPGVSKLRKTKAVGDEALDALETTARVSALIEVGVGVAVLAWKVALALGWVKAGDAFKAWNAVLEAASKAVAV